MFSVFFAKVLDKSEEVWYNKVTGNETVTKLCSQKFPPEVPAPGAIF